LPPAGKRGAPEGNYNLKPTTAGEQERSREGATSQLHEFTNQVFVKYREHRGSSRGATGQ